MQVNFNFFQPTNKFMNVSGVNQALNRKNATVNGTDKEANKDRLTISPQGKAMNAIKNLMEQKERIVEQKSELVTKTLDSGGNLKSIKTQLDTYAKQLSEIDKQIAQIAADQIKEATEKDDKKKAEKSDESKTDEQLETQQLSKIASISNDVKDAKVVASVKNKVEGEARVNESEIKLGKVYVDTLESRGIDGTVNVDDMINNANKMIDKAKQDTAALTKKAVELGTVQAKQMGTATNKLKENAEPSADKSTELWGDTEKSDATDIPAADDLDDAK